MGTFLAQLSTARLVVDACHSSNLKAEAGESLVQDQPKPHNEVAVSYKR